MPSLQIIDSPEDKAKFETLYLTYRGLMFHIAHGILKNEYDAEDAVHNAFLSIAKNLSKIDQPRGPKTRSYISIVCEHKAIDLYRKRQKERGKSLQDEEALPAPPAEGPELDSHNLAWCILQLSPQDREVILLKYKHGFSIREISEILDISFDAASKRDQRAKTRLNELCKREGIL